MDNVHCTWDLGPIKRLKWQWKLTINESWRKNRFPKWVFSCRVYVALIDWKFGLVLIEPWKISVARQTTNHLLSWREELSVKTPLNHLDTDVQIRGAAKSRHKSKQWRSWFQSTIFISTFLTIWIGDWGKPPPTKKNPVNLGQLTQTCEPIHPSPQFHWFYQIWDTKSEFILFVAKKGSNMQ